MKIGWLYLALALGMTSVFFAQADDKDIQSNQVLQWLKQGKVLPLEEILQRHEKRIDGRLLDVEVEKEGSIIIYELKVLRKDSSIFEIKINAKTGQWLKEEIED